MRRTVRWNLAEQPVFPDAPADEPGWEKNRPAIRNRFRDLAYLPRGRSAWNGTLAAWAFAARRALADRADLNLWAAMHGLPPSARYERLGRDALVCWHGTSALRARKIREYGLFHRDGVWAATRPTIAHSFTRGRSQQFGAGSAMVVLVVSKEEWDPHATPRGPNVVEFHRNVPRECIEYILWSDRLEFVGVEKGRQPRPWGVARFKRAAGRWIPQSRPPVRLDGQHVYRDFDEWLEMSIRRILAALGRAAMVEVFSSLYATLDPWEALEHRQVFDTVERLCGKPRTVPGGMQVFSLPAAP